MGGGRIRRSRVGARRFGRDGRGAVLAPVRPNVGIEATYRRRLLAMIDEMAASVAHWVRAQYQATPPVMAADAMPAAELDRAIRELTERWERRFDALAPALAEWFAVAAQRRSTEALKASLRRGGFTVKFKMTRAQRDIMNATISEQVGLIKSIPQQYLGQVRGLVMRSVQVGRDLGPLTRDLQRKFGVTRRRAALIARDQNSKATASMIRARQIELNITQAIWLHSGGGKEPRRTHVANSGKTYDTSKGWYDPDERKWLFPGEAINCRCVSKSIIPGFS